MYFTSEGFKILKMCKQKEIHLMRLYNRKNMLVMIVTMPLYNLKTYKALSFFRR